jgi:FPC/CPF motif-containing protein YcgG
MLTFPPGTAGREPADAERIPADAERGPAEAIVGELERMVLHSDYPCLGAQSVFRQQRATVRVFDRLGTQEAARALLEELAAFARDVDVADGFASFVAVFRSPAQAGSESEFERLLWTQLRLLHQADRKPWDESVSADPDNPHFGFSVAGNAYFVVGLHPDASRLARRTPLPTLVFNLHEQFDRLRASEKFERMRDAIRRRDTRLQGSINPMVRDFGRESEARQYAGREVPEDWSAPFEARAGDDPRKGQNR